MPLSAYYPLCDAIALLLQPQAEVVLHDLATETVAHIANPFSHREVGEPSLLHEIDFRPDVALIGPYEKVNFDGRPLYPSKGIRQSNTAVGQPSRIDHPTLDVGAILVEEIDQFPFVVALKKRKRVNGKGEFDFIL